MRKCIFVGGLNEPDKKTIAALPEQFCNCGKNLKWEGLSIDKIQFVNPNKIEKD